jgi:tetratricopeptide (TPR) repeat protein
MRARRLDLAEIEPLGAWMPVRRALGVTGFGVNGWTADRDEEVVEDHAEPSGHQELYLVVRGRARFRSDDEEFEAGPGELAFYGDGEIRRGAIALEDGTLVLAVGGNHAAPYEPAAWEHWYLADAHIEAGEPEKAAAVLAAGLAEHPGHARMHVYLAGAEALAGRLDDALVHLRRGLELDPEAARRAALEHIPDQLTPLHERPDWPL